MYAQGAEFGRNDYSRSCAACHGETGKGDGPSAKSLKIRPADLTKLSEANKGVFPISRAYNVIDGRIEVLTHGTRDMPVWGDTFRKDLTARLPRDFNMPKELTDEMVRERIIGLIEYISTMQSSRR